MGWVLRQFWRTSSVTVPAVLPASTRLVAAFRLLFKASAEIYEEEKAVKGGVAARRCVLLFDEMHELTKDGGLAAAGGMTVFRQLAIIICSECVDRKSVLVAVAGSSAELDVAFQPTVMSGNRWRYYRLPDPEPAVVVEALCTQGAEATAAQRLVDALGTRMRLLSAVLTTPAGVDADKHIAEQRSAAVSHVRALFRQLSAADGLKVAGVLDAVAEGTTALYADVPLTVRPLLYLNQDQRLGFQSVPHERVWKEGGLRAEVLRCITRSKDAVVVCMLLQHALQGISCFGDAFARPRTRSVRFCTEAAQRLDAQPWTTRATGSAQTRRAASAL